MKTNRKTLKIVTIGGGHGAPTIIRSLVSAGYANICAITASTDSGGRSGMSRTDERDRVISIGDWANCLFALIDSLSSEKPNVKAFLELASFTDGRKRNMGYSMFYGLLEMYDNNFSQVQKHLAQMLNIKFSGLAIPVTSEPTHIYFETKNGNQYQGEHELDVYQMSRDEVIKFWIEPEVTALRESVEAIEKADYIIYCPGSLYGSLLANFSPNGICEALNRSKAYKILIPNLVSDRNQTNNFNLDKYFEIFSRHTGLATPFDLAIVPDVSRSQFEKKHSEISKRYADEYSHILDLQPEVAWRKSHPQVKIIEADIMTITPHKRLRHDPHELAKLWSNILK